MFSMHENLTAIQRESLWGSNGTACSKTQTQFCNACMTTTFKYVSGQIHSFAWQSCFMLQLVTASFFLRDVSGFFMHSGRSKVCHCLPCTCNSAKLGKVLVMLSSHFFVIGHARWEWPLWYFSHSVTLSGFSYEATAENSAIRPVWCTNSDGCRAECGLWITSLLPAQSSLSFTQFHDSNGKQDAPYYIIIISDGKKSIIQQHTSNMCSKEMKKVNIRKLNRAQVTSLLLVRHYMRQERNCPPSEHQFDVECLQIYMSGCWEYCYTV